MYSFDYFSNTTFHGQTVSDVSLLTIQTMLIWIITFSVKTSTDLNNFNLSKKGRTDKFHCLTIPKLA